MASMRMDCGRLRIQTREELERYMDGSGASVGRIMAVILGAPEESERLGRLGVAFQLTNFLRDLREDYALDRIYLPADERERHGVGEGDLAAESASPAPQGARRGGGPPRTRRCSPRRRRRCVTAIPSARRGIGLARAVYCAVLDRIERNGYDVLGRASRPRLVDLARVAVRSR